MKIPPALLSGLQKLLGKENVLTDVCSLLLYAGDCAPAPSRPDGVLIIRQSTQLPAVIRLLNAYKVPFTPRAAATNHAGSTAAPEGGFILNLTHLNRLLEINTREHYAVAEPALITGDLQNALAPLGFFYAPDPASAHICTLGGNLAQHASGARGLKYGGTLEHVLAADLILPTGEEVHLEHRAGAPDWLGLFCGSEGTLGIFTRLKVNILPLQTQLSTYLIPFPALENSVGCVSALAAQGITPRCMEAMDQNTARVIEEFSRAGYPTDVQALLILELDSPPPLRAREEKILRQIAAQFNASQFISADDEVRRERLWAGRRAAYAAMARLAPNVIVGDGTVPRSALPETLKQVRQILDKNNVQAGLLFHAGDGNFHPHILFDQRNPQQAARLHRVQQEILQVCVRAGGTISGEHGIGTEKRSLMAYQYDAPTLDVFARIKNALDPASLANPCKIIPADRTTARAAQAPDADTALFIKNPSAQNLKKLDKILEIDQTNYTATAQAGVTLNQLSRALQDGGVYCILPDGQETLGDVFAFGRCPCFYAHVLGIEAVLHDGSLIRYGGKIMKNAAGYPLPRLFAGTQHRFGFVTAFTFKVFAVKPPVCALAPSEPFRTDRLYEKLLPYFARAKETSHA